MPRLSAVRRAWAAGGPSEVVRRTRIRLAEVIDPRPPPPPPQKPRRKKQPTRPVVSDRTAADVGYEEILAFFTPRRPGYVKLAEAVAPFLKPDGVIFDIGANIGYFTRILSEVTGFTGTSHLFEPVPNLSEISRQTLADSPVTPIYHPYGLGEADLSTTIYLGRGNLGWNTIIGERSTEEMVPIEIEIRNFASLDLEQAPDFIKIDVEGAEYRVLDGLIPAMESWDLLPPILCEIGWGTGHPDWQAELLTFDKLFALGYAATDLTGTPIDVRTIARTTDVLFLPAAAKR